MSRLEKIYQKAKNSSANLTFQDVCYLAENVGFVQRGNQKGSHKIYKHPGIHDIQDAMVNVQDDNGSAKSYQVEILLNIIEKYNLLNLEGEDP